MMQGQVKPDVKPPAIDLWRRFIDLDGATLKGTTVNYGQLFLKDDRDLAKANVYKVIEMSMIPFIAQRIVQINDIVSKTRRGLGNMFKNMFKKTERNENDGERVGFKMNKQDIELRSLVDTSFIVQDYETVMKNVQYPIDEFQKIRAFRHCGHLDELKLYSKMIRERNVLTVQFKDFVKEADQIFHTYHKKAVGANFDLVKFVIYITEIYQELGKHKEASDMFVRLAGIYPQHPIKALLYEQAAFEFLYMRQYRKFALHMQQAATIYENCKFRDFQINCLMILHPFYETHVGWNHI
jgi:hypothetical protein